MDNDDTVAAKLLKSGRPLSSYGNQPKCEIGSNTPSEFFHLYVKKHDEFN